MTASVATMVEDDTAPAFGQSDISSSILGLVLVSAMSSSQVSAAELPDGWRCVPVETRVGTTDEILSFDGETGSAAVLHDVETRSTALSAWIRSLDEVCEAADTENWDGEGAAPVQEDARRYAVALVAELAEGTRFPDVAIDPDGEISLGWQDDADVFSVSISGAGRFSYAGLLGTSDCHGTEWMVEQVPLEVTRQLDRFLLAHRTSGQPD